MFEKILIANRGEIAVRIIRTCRKMGIRTVAVYSEADVRSMYVRQADEAVAIGPAPAAQSYLNMDRVIRAALETGAQAIHPGYGFLSENPEFARQVQAAGLVFIGPPAEVIAALGDKIAAKKLAMAAGLAVVPGHADPLADAREAARAAEKTGYPVLLKPAAGGGGRGMRVVARPEDMDAAFKASQEETQKAFGDSRVFLERFIDRPRHVEVQILADRFGNVVHLGERECSIQRRHQKVIEETPSPAVNPDLRKTMGEAARNLARQAGYVNAGTVEFILDPGGAFYFLEMNTRLQVEHPVTELITGLDLVEWQLKVASGDPLPLEQDQIQFNGWAIEARICAEDPARGFLPAAGLITRYAQVRGRHVRLDDGIEAGSVVPVFYDSLLAKIAAWGPTREAAIDALIGAVNRYHVEGVVTNMDFANAVLNLPSFRQGDLHTGFIAEHFTDGRPKTPPDERHVHYMVMAATLIYHNRQNLVRASLRPMAARLGRTTDPKLQHEYVVVHGELGRHAVVLRRETDGGRRWRIRVGDREYNVITPEFEFYRRRLKLDIDGQTHYFRLEYRENFMWTAFSGIQGNLEVYSPREWALAEYMPRPAREETSKELKAPMPGLVVDVRVTPGTFVYRGQDVVTIESMKMQSGVASHRDGVVETIRVSTGKSVETGEVLITFAP